MRHLDLDEAMLTTRDFWFQAPTDCDNSWTPVLEVYEQQPSWPTLKPPEPKDFLSTPLHTKDSAPGKINSLKVRFAAAHRFQGFRVKVL